MTRLSHYSMVAVVCLSVFARADLKIKTRTTVMGHTSESTVYIKGARERNEMSYGGHGGAVIITQCDQKRAITITGNQCMVMPMEVATLPARRRQTPGLWVGTRKKNLRFLARAVL